MLGELEADILVIVGCGWMEGGHWGGYKYVSREGCGSRLVDGRCCRPIGKQ
jgi:hypothetical protein